MPESDKPKRTLFGRQKSHKLSKRQQQLVETRLNELRLDLTVPFKKHKTDHHEQEIWLEIGFGGGEHLAAMAARHKDVIFIGCEPFINGVAKLLVTMEEQNLTNIRIYDDDARHLLDWLPSSCISRAFILYPDPWPKKRHHKRRFISPETLSKLAHVMHQGADLLIASDISDYIRTCLIALSGSNDFEWTAKNAKSWQQPPEQWLSTRYEQKAIKAGRTPTYLKIKRL